MIHVQLYTSHLAIESANLSCNRNLSSTQVESVYFIRRWNGSPKREPVLHCVPFSNLPGSVLRSMSLNLGRGGVKDCLTPSPNVPYRVQSPMSATSLGGAGGWGLPEPKLLIKDRVDAGHSAKLPLLLYTLLSHSADAFI